MDEDNHLVERSSSSHMQRPPRRHLPKQPIDVETGGKMTDADIFEDSNADVVVRRHIDRKNDSDQV